VKHLICACTGMPRQDMEWLFEYRSETPASAMTLLGTMQPTSRFGEVFQYSNLMAAAAGFIGGAKAVPGKEWGSAYDEAMRAKVFGPLGMTTTTFDFAAALKGDVAQPHGDDVDGKVTRARMDLNYSVVPVRPAGASGRARGSWPSTSRWSWPRDAPGWEAAGLGGEPAGAVQAARHRRRGPDLRDGPDGRHAVRHPGGPPRRRPCRLPQRHDLAAGARGWRGDPHQRRLGRHHPGPLLRRLLEVLFDGSRRPSRC